MSRTLFSTRRRTVDHMVITSAACFSH